MKTTRWLWWAPWAITALVLFLLSVGATRAGGVAAAGSGSIWLPVWSASATSGAVPARRHRYVVADDAKRREPRALKRMEDWL